MFLEYHLSKILKTVITQKRQEDSENVYLSEITTNTVIVYFSYHSMRYALFALALVNVPFHSIYTRQLCVCIVLASAVHILKLERYRED